MARVNDLVELYQESCTKYAARPLFGTKKDGGWTWTTYGQFGALVDQVRGGLALLGVGKGDRVACIADNCIEWAAAAYATYGLEASFVPMYQSQRPSEWEFILGDCGAKVVFVANETIFAAVEAMRPRLPQLGNVIGFSRPLDAPGSWRALVQEGTKTPAPARRPAPQDIAGFIYTSGTTGKPKGVLLSHENISSNLNAIHEIFPMTCEDRSLAFLPWAHAFGQTCELHMAVSFGSSIALNDEIDRLIENLAVIRPTILVAVPRIFNKIYALVNQQIAGRPPFLQKIIRDGLRSATRRARGERLGLRERVELAFDDKVVFSKIRARFGGRLKYVISGSATLGHDVASFIDAVGLPVYEGYGLTETSPIATANRPGAHRIGSVGQPIPGVKVILDKSKA
ncbi:MAG TPA: AMP-binding protein, partial [Myxococcales bacterium]